MRDKQDKNDKDASKPTTQPPATVPAAEATNAGVPKPVLRFHGGRDGDGRFLRGLPQRDLFAADLVNLTPGQFRDATAPGPTGTPLYTVADNAAVAERFGGDKE